MTSILNLESDIKQFMKYGVVLSAIDYRDLRKTIEDNYLYLRDTPITLEADTRLDSLLGQVKDYLSISTDLINDDFCFIPVTVFNDLAGDCGYGSYEMKALRERLAKDGYIRIQSGRYAILKRIKNRPERVIAFYREKIGMELPKDSKLKHGDSDA